MPSWLCLLTDQCCHNSPSTSPSCLSVRVVSVQKHTMLACSNYSLSHLTLFCARHYHSFLPGSGFECVASRPVPVSVADFICSSLCLVSVLLSRTCSIYFPWKKLGQRSTRGTQSPQQPWREAEDRQLAPEPWPQPLLLRDARLALQLEQHLVLRGLGQGPGIVVFIKRLWNLSWELVVRPRTAICNPGFWPCCFQRGDCWELILLRPVTNCRPLWRRQDQAVPGAQKQCLT